MILIKGPTTRDCYLMATVTFRSRVGDADHEAAAVAHAFGRAIDILKSRRADLEDGAELLLSRESLTAEDFPVLRSTAGGSSGDRAVEARPVPAGDVSA